MGNNKQAAPICRWLEGEAVGFEVTRIIRLDRFSDLLFGRFGQINPIQLARSILWCSSVKTGYHQSLLLTEILEILRADDARNQATPR